MLLISLTKRLREGYMMVAHGPAARLVSPEGDVTHFVVHNGLLKPCEHAYDAPY